MASTPNTNIVSDDAQKLNYTLHPLALPVNEGDHLAFDIGKVTRGDSSETFTIYKPWTAFEMLLSGIEVRTPLGTRYLQRLPDDMFGVQEETGQNAEELIANHGDEGPVGKPTNSSANELINAQAAPVKKEPATSHSVPLSVDQSHETEKHHVMSEPATFVPLPVHEGWDSAVQDGAAAAPQPVQEQAALEPAPKPTRRRNPYEQYYEIRPSQTGGLGCFAVRDIDEGVVILMEKPMLDTTVYNLRRDLATLPKAVNAHFYTLAHDASVDRFAKVEDIWHKNAFEVPSGIAIFAIASRFNHACEPVFNVVYAWDRFKNVMTFCTKRAVKAGEELRITYGGCPLSLYVRYGFICQCGGCDSVSRAQAEEHRPYIWR